MDRPPLDKPPDVGLDANGNATFAWMRLDATQSCVPGDGGCWQVQAVRRSASGVMGEVRTLSPVSGISAVNQQVQVAANGDAVVAWEQPGHTDEERIVARVRRASTGVWGQPRYISGEIPLHSPNADASFDLKMNAQGDAEFAWLQTTNGRNAGRVFVRSWSHTGSLGPKTSAGVGEVGSPRVAVLSDGAAIVAWTSQDGETCGTHPCVQLHARPISAASVLGPTEEVSPPDQRVVRGTQRLAVNTAGAALFAWQQEDPSGCPYPAPTRCSRVLVRGRSATGEFAPRQIASEGSGLLPIDLQLGLDGDGGSVVVWLESKQVRNESCFHACSLQLVERSAAGDLSPVQTITTSPGGVDQFAPRSPELQLAPNGDGLLTWLAGDGDLDGCPTWDWGCMRMRTMDRAPDGSLGPIETVSPGGQDAISSQIALAPNGTAAAVWGVGDLGYQQPAAPEYVQGAVRAAPGSP
ncbi:MAG TPA: hypothetical protein VEP94_05090 [Solirubrobacterales bacterium]|nr:hypothetical protein [Solirubrobacterales bacterium]